MNIRNVQNPTILSTPKPQDAEKNVQSIVKSTKESNPIEITKTDEQKKNNLLSQDPEELRKSLKELTEGLNEKMAKIFNRKLDFTVHEDTHRMMVKVIDTEEEKVIREIPPEEILDLVAKMEQTFGLFVDVRI